MNQTSRNALLRACSLALLLGCTDRVPSDLEENAIADIARSPAVSAADAITGLDFPGNFPPNSGKTVRFKFANPHLNGLPIYGPGGNGVTYIWRVYPREQVAYKNSYYTAFFWGNDGAFQWRNGRADTYYGAHPYPRFRSDNTYDWEIATDGIDAVQGGGAGLVRWNRWYTQAFVAWVDQATGRKMHRYYWDLDNPDANHTVEYAADAVSANTNPPNPALTWGDAPWSPGNEVMDGIIRGIQIYNNRLSLSEIQSEVAAPLSTSTGSSAIWYLNINPTPSDISDKSGRGHHPAWVGPERPSLYSEVPQNQDTSAPSVPSNVVATPVSSSQINLTWSVSSDNVGVTGYRIHRGGVQIASVVSGTTYQDTGLSASTSYSYTVYAYDAAGNVSASSAAATATTSSSGPPAPPPNGLIGHWTFDEESGTTAIDSTGFFNGTLAGGAVRTTGTRGGAIQFDGTNDKVDLGTSFNIGTVPFTIAAWINPTNFATYHSILTKRDGYAPARMRFQFDLDRGNGNVRLMNASASGTTFGYAPPLGVWTHVAVVARSGATELYVNGVLRQSVARTFVLGSASAARAAIGDLGGETGENFAGRIDDVRVYHGGLSAAEIQAIYASSADTNPPPDTSPPSTPTGLGAVAVSSSQINLTWSPSSDNVAVTSYRVYRGGVQIATVASGTSYQDTGLSPATSYSYTVRAADAAGNVSGHSATSSATTPSNPDTSPPSVPANLSATAVSSSQIDLSWSASSDNVGVASYRVRRNGVEIATVVSGSTYRDSGLAPSTSYSYTVRAVDAAGNSSASSAAASATTHGEAPPPPTDGLIAHWSLNDGSGSTVTDSSGNNRTGTVQNGASWTAGKRGGALSFDGSNDKVDLGTAFNIPAVPFTITAWVNPRDYDYFHSIVSKRNSYSFSGMRFQFDLDNGTGQVRLLNAASSGTTFNYSPPIGVWTHLAVIARSGATELYVNGVLRQRVSRTFALGSASGARAAIGDLGGESGESFSGRLDDIRVYNRALTPEEIQRLQ